MIFLEAGAADAGVRLDALVARAVGCSRGAAQEAVRSGHISVNEAVEKPSYRIRPGDRIRGSVPDRSLVGPRPESIPVEVRYEDDWVAVVSKPAGLVVHAGAGRTQGTLVNALLGRGMRLAGGDPERPGIVHRLDKDTSGLLVVAKDEATHRKLTAALRQRAIARHYLALVRGRPPSETGTIDAPLARHPVKRRAMAVAPGGRPAVTHYAAIAEAHGASLLHVRLETGRTHQIRAHLSHLGHPVLGDAAYGGRGDLSARAGLERPFLHAFRVVFRHPQTTEEVAVDDPLPADLLAALDALGLPPAARRLPGVVPG